MKMRIIEKEYKARADFPYRPNEMFRVRNGDGKILETWKFLRAEKDKSHSYLTYEIENYQEEI